MLHEWQRAALDGASRRRRHAYAVFSALLSFGQAKRTGGTLARYGRIFPSTETIARLVCLPERTVQLTLQELRRWGLCRWATGNSRRANEYAITESAGELMPSAIEAMADELAAAGPDAKLEELERRCRLWLRFGRMAQSAAPNSAVRCAEGRSPLRGTRAQPTAPQVEGIRSTNKIQQKQKPTPSAAAAAVVAAQEGEGKQDQAEPRQPTEGQAEAIEQVKAMLADRDINEPKRSRLAGWLIDKGLKVATIEAEIRRNRRIAGGLGVHILEADSGAWLKDQRKAEREAAEWDAREAERRRQAGREAVAKTLEAESVRFTMDAEKPSGAAELIEELAAGQPIDMDALNTIFAQAFAKGAGREPDAGELAALVEEFLPIARQRKALAKLNKHINPTAADPEPTAEELPIVSRIAELMQPAEQQAQAFRPPVAVALPQASPQPEAMAELLSGDLVQRIGELPAEEQEVFKRVVGPKIQAIRAAKRRAKARHVGRAVGGDASTTFEDAIDGGGASTAFEATIDGGSAATFAAVAA